MRRILAQMKRGKITQGTVVYGYVNTYGGVSLVGAFVYDGKSLRYLGFHPGEHKPPLSWRDFVDEFRYYNKRKPTFRYVTIGTPTGPAYYA